MSKRTILLSDLVGRKVRDVEGRVIGRIQELHAEIELHEHGNDYVVREFHIGIYGAFEALAGSRFAQRAVQRLGRFVGYRTFSIPWNSMDLTDQERPRVTRPIAAPR